MKMSIPFPLQRHINLSIYRKTKNTTAYCRGKQKNSLHFPLEIIGNICYNN